MSRSLLCRRRFMAHGAGVALAGAVGACSTRKNARGDNAHAGSGAEHTADEPGAQPSPEPQRARSSAVVSAVRSERHIDALDRAIVLAGGLSVRSGDTVVLKVNTNSGDPFPYSTSPIAVQHLATRFRDAGARVVVCDRSFWGDDDTAGNFRDNGIAAAARDAGAELVVLDEALDWVEIPRALVPSWTGPVRVPRLLVEADLLVNLPCLKTHFISGVTLALKNLLGAVHAEDRMRPGNLRVHDPDRVHMQIAELHRHVRPHMHVLDGHRALVSGGPTPSSGRAPTVVRTNTVMACRDPVALDAVGIALLATLAPPTEMVTRTKTWQQPTLAAAAQLGVGIRGPHALDLVAEGFDGAELEARATIGG